MDTNVLVYYGYNCYLEAAKPARLDTYNTDTIPTYSVDGRKYYNLHNVCARVASDTSFKEGYFFGAFSILPDTSFLLWS